MTKEELLKSDRVGGEKMEDLMQYSMTLQEKSVYDFINKYIQQEQYPPSIREICEGVGFKSTSTIQRILRRLEDKGYIIKKAKKKRAIRIVG